VRDQRTGDRSNEYQRRRGGQAPNLTSHNPEGLCQLLPVLSAPRARKEPNLAMLLRARR
jgi:hypothetical protein